MIEANPHRAIPAAFRPAVLALTASLASVMAAGAAHFLGWSALGLPVAVVAATWVVLDIRAAFTILLLLIAVAGSELRAGPLRLLDAVCLLAVVGIAWNIRTWADLRRPGVIQTLPVAVVALAVLVAFARGIPVGLAVTDLHNALVAVALYVVGVAAVKKFGGDTVVALIALMTAVAAAKAVALAVLPAPISLNGSATFLQATIIPGQLGTKRVVLIGADTLIALGPAICFAARTLPAMRGRRWLALFVLTGIGTVVTETRTDLIAGVAALMIALALDAMTTNRATGNGQRVAAFMAAPFALALVVLVINVGDQGIADVVTSRFTSASDIQVSLRYRSDEAARLRDALRGHDIVGLGAGATFYTEVPGISGATTYATFAATPWAHNGFLWMMLKAGIVGLALFSAAILAVGMRLLKNRDHALARVGLIAVGGVLLLSITTNRFSDPGAALLLGLALGAARRETA
jgi:hypothetical protein